MEEPYKAIQERHAPLSSTESIVEFLRVASVANFGWVMAESPLSLPIFRLFVGEVSGKSRENHKDLMETKMPCTLRISLKKFPFTASCSLRIGTSKLGVNLQ